MVYHDLTFCSNGHQEEWTQWNFASFSANREIALAVGNVKIIPLVDACSPSHKRLHNGKPLSLSTRQLLVFLTTLCLVPIWQSHDDLMCICHTTCFFDVFLGGLVDWPCTKSDIKCDCALQYHRVTTLGRVLEGDVFELSTATTPLMDGGSFDESSEFSSGCAVSRSVALYSRDIRHSYDIENLYTDTICDALVTPDGSRVAGFRSFINSPKTVPGSGKGFRLRRRREWESRRSSCNREKTEVWCRRRTWRGFPWLTYISSRIRPWFGEWVREGFEGWRTQVSLGTSFPLSSPSWLYSNGPSSELKHRSVTIKIWIV